ncbi:MAG: hypothetical protein ACC645_27510, partial [Pirellulales bacterium]
LSAGAVGKAQIREIGSRLEPLVDDFLIERTEGVSLELHRPIPREVAFVFDAPWEGNTSAYVTLFRDGDRFRMYYRGSRIYDPVRDAGQPGAPERTCLAESADGIVWKRVEVNRYEFEGIGRNNIVWEGIGTSDFAPLKDGNPNCSADARYKAIGAQGRRLYAFRSPDGIDWSMFQDEPVLTEGRFDSQNVALWHPLHRRYEEFHRNMRDGFRDVQMCSSTDFLHWSKPRWLDWGNAPSEHLYTNAITIYQRAPHIYLGFPMRFNPSRQGNHKTHGGVSDGQFMTSRDGLHWHRWIDAFVRPGPHPWQWVSHNNLIAWGILRTKSSVPGSPDELSLYVNEGYFVGPCRLRRHTLRLDGFVSVHASASGGEMVTHPLVFAGTTLTMNFATSAAGGIRVEIQDAGGRPIEGFALADATEIYGDEIERIVSWKSGTDVSRFAGKPIRLRFALKDADLYAIQFRP